MSRFARPILRSRPALLGACAVWLAGCTLSLPSTSVEPDGPAWGIPDTSSVYDPGVPLLPAGVQGGGTGSTSLRALMRSVVVGLEQEVSLASYLRDNRGLQPTGGVLWISSRPDLVTVNPLSGQVKGLAIGRSTVTASLQANAGVQVQFDVEVLNQQQGVRQIVISPQTPTMNVGESLQLIAQVQMADGTVSGNVDWSSADDTIARVNKTTGQVSALRPGSVTIVGAYSLDPRFKAVSAITIIAPTPAPTATPTATPTPTPAPTATPTASPSPTPTPTPTPTPSASAGPV